MFIIFDGTTHVCEAFVVVLCYLIDDLELKQCVGQLKLLAKTMTGEEIAQQVIVILSTEFGISSNLIVAAMRDRASVNDVAMRTIKVVYNELLDVGCFPHTLNHMGERMNTPILHDFSATLGLLCFHKAQNPVCCGGPKHVSQHLHTPQLSGGVNMRLFIVCSKPSVM